MTYECEIVDGKAQIPKSWLESFKQRVGHEADIVVFDLSDASPLVPAGVFLKANVRSWHYPARG